MTLRIAAVLIAGLAFVGGCSNTSKDAGDAAATDMELPPWMMLTEGHERMHSMLGTWEGSVRFKMDDEWTESTGTMERELAMDGRFVIEHVTATSDMGEFKGMGIMGYNPMTERYESVWIENMATNITSGTGTYDEATEKWTFEGPMMDPMTGEMVDSLTIVDTSNPDMHVMVGYAVVDGERDMNFEGTFARVK